MYVVVLFKHVYRVATVTVGHFALVREELSVVPIAGRWPPLPYNYSRNLQVNISVVKLSKEMKRIFNKIKIFPNTGNSQQHL